MYCAGRQLHLCYWRFSTKHHNLHNQHYELVVSINKFEFLRGQRVAHPGRGHQPQQRDQHDIYHNPVSTIRVDRQTASGFISSQRGVYSCTQVSMFQVGVRVPNFQSQQRGDR